jgi:outer membrane protein assembly factor BamB
MTAWNTGQPRPSSPSCLGSLIRLLLIGLLFGGIGYAMRPTIDGWYRQITAGGGTAAPTKSAGGADDPPPTAATAKISNVDVLAGSTRWMADINNDEISEVLGLSYGSEEFSLVALDGANGQPLWAAPLGDRESHYLVEAGDYILAIHDQRVRAFQIGDGAFAWTAQLPDKIAVDHPIPVAFALPDAVVLQSNDNALTSLSLQTGAENWQVTLKDRYATDLARLGDNVCTDPQYAEGDAIEIACYSLKTGEQAQTYPVVADSSSYARWWPDPTSADYFYLAEYSYDEEDRIALQRIKAADGSVQWTQPLAGFDRVDDIELRASDNLLAVAANDRLAILTDGGAPVIVQQDETRLYPIGFDGGKLYLLAIKLRGTNTFAVQQVDAVSGAVAWKTDPLGENSGSDWPGMAVAPGQGVLIGWQDNENSEATHVRLIGGDGSSAWTYDRTLLIGYVPKISRSANRALVTISDEVVMLDTRSGAVQWEIGD